jgi:hypothetical protein
LFELIARYRRDADLGDQRVGVTNYLAWPVHVSLRPEEVTKISETLTGVADLIFLTMKGEVMPFHERQRLAPRPAGDEESADGLTAMRSAMIKMSDARITLGGKVVGHCRCKRAHTVSRCG